MSKMSNKKIGIIGAGAAGLAVATTISQFIHEKELDSKNLQVHVFERNSEVGKKILATGNGKCNITNINAHNFIETRDFFDGLGMLLTNESEGRMYPHSKQAKSVRDTLLASIDTSIIKIMTDTHIKNVVNNHSGFTIYDEKNNPYSYNKLIITTGGKAGMQYGSEGDGLRFARELGIDTVKIMPALVPMIYGKNPGFDLPSLKGVRVEATLTLQISGETVAVEKGELQFTDYGLSGICIFNLSRFLRDAPREDNDITDTKVLIDFAPQFTIDQLNSVLKRGLGASLKGVVNEKVERLIIAAGYDPVKDANIISKLLKSFSVNIKGTKGWKEAQVTSGGIDLEAVNQETMESKDVKNLYFAGEILNYDGPCGGYNLDWAFSTGIKAGKGVLEDTSLDD